MDKKPEKLCNICKEKMIGKPVSQIGNYATVEFICPRKNCPRNKFPLTDQQNLKK